MNNRRPPDGPSARDRLRRGCGRGGLSALVLLLAAAPAHGQKRMALDDLAFMSGTWCGAPDGDGTLIEEHYTTPSSNLMLGTTRYVRAGETIMFELTRIEAAGDSIVLYPMPRGQPSVGFRLSTARAGAALFENPTHDFPVRIVYRRDGQALVARVEGPDGEGAEWTMTACAGVTPDLRAPRQN